MFSCGQKKQDPSKTEQSEVHQDESDAILKLDNGNLWTANSETWLALKSQLTVDVHEALKKAKIEIPFPQRDLHIKSGESLNMDNKSTITKIRAKKNPLK